MVNDRSILTFLGLTFGVSWLIAAILYFTGMEYGTPGSLILVAVLYMTAPALAAWHVHVYTEGKPAKSIGWRWEKQSASWLWKTPVLFLIGIGLTLGILFLFGNILNVSGFGQLHFSQDHINDVLKDAMAAAGQSEDIPAPPMGPVALFITLLITGVLIGGTVNIPFTFGEEFGWRGFLLERWRKYGFWKTQALMGIFWGVWHAPIILMGHNYPAHPWEGIGMMVAFCFGLSLLHNYVMLKSGSILFPAMLHGMINGTAGAVNFFIADSSSLLGSFQGLAGALGFLLLSIGILLMDRKHISTYYSSDNEHAI